MKSADLAGILQHNGDFIKLVLLLMFWPGCTMTSACHEPHFHILNNIFRNNLTILPIFYWWWGRHALLSPILVTFAQILDLFSTSHPPRAWAILRSFLGAGFWEKNVLYPMVFHKAVTVMSKSNRMTECPIGIGVREGLAPNVFSPDLV